MSAGDLADLTLLVFLALGMAEKLAVLCQPTREPDRPANTQAAADPAIMHLVGSVRQGGQGHPFDIWLDASNERFVVDRARRRSVPLREWRSPNHGTGWMTALKHSIAEAFEFLPAIQALDYFAF